MPPDVLTDAKPSATRQPSATIWVDATYRPALQNAGLHAFDDVMQTTAGHCLRALAIRENWRLELHTPHAGVRGAYLKKHKIRSPWLWLRARLGLGPGRTAGRVEAENVAALARDGIDAMRLIAFGEKLHTDGRLESFVLTEELAGYTQLDHFLRKRFHTLVSRTVGRDLDLDRLTADVATLARRFHERGYNHRDLYCCHFFVSEGPRGRFALRLIDLQRVQQRRWFRRRWVVKDLAQLSYSAPRERISNTQRLRFMKRYLGVRKLGPDDKRLIRAILMKHRGMERRLGAHP